MNEDRLLKNIFTSASRVDLISYFFRHEGLEIYMSMLKNELGKNLSSYQKELDNLVKIKFINEKKQGNLRMFSLNTSFVFYSELKSIFYRSKLLSESVASVLREYEDVEYAFLYEKNIEGTNESTRALYVDVNDESRKIIAVGKAVCNKLAEAANRVDYRVYRKSDIRELLKKGDSEASHAINAHKDMFYAK